MVPNRETVESQDLNARIEYLRKIVEDAEKTYKRQKYNASEELNKKRLTSINVMKNNIAMLEKSIDTLLKKYATVLINSKDIENDLRGIDAYKDNIQTPTISYNPYFREIRDMYYKSGEHKGN